MGFLFLLMGYGREGVGSKEVLTSLNPCVIDTSSKDKAKLELFRI